MKHLPSRQLQQSLLPLLSLLLLAASLLLALPAAAETPKDNEVIITADTANIDQQKRQVVYSGNVIITRANFEIRAEKVTYTGKDEQQIFICEGKQVEVYWKEQATSSTTNQARADYIRYVASDRKTLDMRGKVWITMGKDTVEGDEIFYDFTSKQLKAKGNQDQRVRFVITNDK